MDGLPIGFECKVQVQRAEVVTKPAELRQQANWAGWSLSGGFVDKSADFGVERHTPVEQPI